MTSCLFSNDQPWDGTVRIRISVCHTNLGVNSEAVLTGSVDNGWDVGGSSLVVLPTTTALAVAVQLKVICQLSTSSKDTYKLKGLLYTSGHLPKFRSIYALPHTAIPIPKASVCIVTNSSHYT